MLPQAQALAPWLTEVRRDLHRHPELGFQEHRTASVVADTLKSMGLRVQTAVGKTGVVGYLGASGPVVALRADMDALPIQEANSVDYASQTPGVMHACGHDAHVACLLGAARLLKDNPPDGQVRFFFQPSEEGADAEGKSGARRMIDDGAMDGVEAIFGQHVETEGYVGTMQARPGPVAAGSDSFRGVVKGVAAHGASPYTGVDAILLSSHVIGALNTITSRRIAGTDWAVITIGTIQGGTKENIVCDAVELKGTIRSFDPRVRETLLREIENAFAIAKSFGGDFEVEIRQGYPALVNEPRLTGFATRVLGDLLGNDNVTDSKIEMGSEDFSMFAALAPGCFLNLCSRTPGTPVRQPHNPTFDIDEACLPIGAAALAELATRYLRERPLTQQA
jgi:amidohydrolase